MRKRYRQDRETGKLVEIHQDNRIELHGLGAPFEPFRSPVDGTWVDTPKKLEEHNKRNHVAPMEQYQDEIDRRTERRAAVHGAGRFDTKERTESLKLAYELHSQGRSKADIRQTIDNFIQHHHRES